MNARNLASLSAVLLILGAVGYYWGLGPAAQTPVAADDDSTPDYQVQGFSLWQTDSHGQLQKHVQAVSARHYRGDNERSQVEQPAVTVFQQGMPAWHVTAPEALGTRQNRDILLHGGVEAKRLLAGQPLALTTDSLIIHTDSNRMETDDQVRITGTPPNAIQAEGLDANITNDTLNLHHRVEGSYAAHH